MRRPATPPSTSSSRAPPPRAPSKWKAITTSDARSKEGVERRSTTGAEDPTDLVRRVLDFWFGPPRSDGDDLGRKAWFEKNDAFDAAIASAFGEACEKAATGELDAPMASSEGTVALVLLLDQFPRNVYRGTPRCFATDAKARDVSRRAIERGFDRLVPPAHRLFLYLPFEHSENLADQDEACARIFTLGRADWLDYARRHRDIVRRFGRFSHRNAILGHPSTPEELAFLRRSNAFF